MIITAYSDQDNSLECPSSFRSFVWEPSLILSSLSYCHSSYLMTMMQGGERVDHLPSYEVSAVQKHQKDRSLDVGDTFAVVEYDSQNVVHIQVSTLSVWVEEVFFLRALKSVFARLYYLRHIEKQLVDIKAVD